jgi:hypothetical protein
MAEIATRIDTIDLLNHKGRPPCLNMLKFSAIYLPLTFSGTFAEGLKNKTPEFIRG